MPCLECPRRKGKEKKHTYKIDVKGTKIQFMQYRTTFSVPARKPSQCSSLTPEIGWPPPRFKPSLPHMLLSDSA